MENNASTNRYAAHSLMRLSAATNITKLANTNLNSYLGYRRATVSKYNCVSVNSASPEVLQVLYSVIFLFTFTVAVIIFQLQV